MSDRLPRALIVGVFLLYCVAAAGQETVFNVPSADVLDRGKVYGELDLSYNPVGTSGTFTPRIVMGAGHGVEIGLNVNGIAAPGVVQTAPAPTFKWKAYDGGQNGWALLLGDDLFIPVQNRPYHAGNYVYAEFTKTWKTKTRVTFGAYDFTAHVVASGNRAGGQFAVEQPVSHRLTLAADVLTGHHALGYLTPGVIIKITPRLSWYVAYQIGNAGVRDGNHQLLIELGWNFN